MAPLFVPFCQIALLCVSEEPWSSIFLCVCQFVVTREVTAVGTYLPMYSRDNQVIDLMTGGIEWRTEGGWAWKVGRSWIGRVIRWTVNQYDSVYLSACVVNMLNLMHRNVIWLIRPVVKKKPCCLSRLPIINRCFGMYFECT